MEAPPHEVQNAHAFTARMCAATRWHETFRQQKTKDALFLDPLARKLAGKSGLQNPMGEWIMVPRTRFGDDLVYQRYAYGAKSDYAFWNYGGARAAAPHGGTPSGQDTRARQLVLLGAGFDARAYRLGGVEDLRVFEVDQPNLFAVKEPLLVGEKLSVKARHVVGADFDLVDRTFGDDNGTRAGAMVSPATAWGKQLIESHGFDPAVPTVWLLEGLMMYLTLTEQKTIMRDIGLLSPVGSVVFFDAISKTYEAQHINVAGAPFREGSDDYAALCGEFMGFDRCFVRDFQSIFVNRRERRLGFETRVSGEATPEFCRNRAAVLFVTAEKVGPSRRPPSRGSYEHSLACFERHMRV